jgi:hypothetical protein
MNTEELIIDLGREDLLDVSEGDAILVSDWGGAIFKEWVHDGNEPLCANVITLDGKRRIRAGRINRK